MNKRNYYIFALIIILLAVGTWFLTTNSTKSLADDVFKDIKSDTVNSIEIEKDNKEKVTITDKVEIEKILNSLSSIEVKKISNNSKEFNEFYTIFIFANDDRRLGMFLYDDKYINIYDYEASPKKNSSMDYKISNNFDLKVIQDYFQ